MSYFKAKMLQNRFFQLMVEELIALPQTS